jgi:putative ABC transport system permease protein
VETLRRDLHAQTASRPPVRALLAGAVGCVLVAALLTRVHQPLVGLGSIFVLLIAGALATPAAVVAMCGPAARAAQAALGLSARLGVDNVSRELGRSALTACALVLATAMSVTVACYSHSYEASCIQWVEQSVPADIVVTAGSPFMDRYAVPFGPELADDLEKTPGVRVVNRVRSLTVPYASWRLEAVSMETRIYLDRASPVVLEGPSPIPVDALEKEPSVLVSENFAARTGLGPGDKVTLPSPTGPHAFTIVAVVVDYTSDQGWLLLDRRFASELWQDPRIEAVDLYLAPGTDPHAVAADVRRALAARGEGGMFVTTNAALRAEIVHVIRQTFGVSRASEAIALLVAVLGVVGTMLAAVIDRIREIGVLRAIGATQRHILYAVVAEAGFFGVCAAVVGTLTAIPAAIVFVKTVGFDATGWTVPFRFPMLGAARALASVIFFSVASGLFPGLRAARLRITTALAYE